MLTDGGNADISLVVCGKDKRIISTGISLKGQPSWSGYDIFTPLKWNKKILVLYFDYNKHNAGILVVNPQTYALEKKIQTSEQFESIYYITTASNCGFNSKCNIIYPDRVKKQGVISYIIFAGEKPVYSTKNVINNIGLLRDRHCNSTQFSTLNLNKEKRRIA